MCRAVLTEAEEYEPKTELIPKMIPLAKFIAGDKKSEPIRTMVGDVEEVAPGTGIEISIEGEAYCCHEPIGLAATAVKEAQERDAL